MIIARFLESPIQLIFLSGICCCPLLILAIAGFFIYRHMSRKKEAPPSDNDQPKP